MATTVRRAQVYRPGLWRRLAEGLRYGGGIGQWSWLLHRVTGIGIVIFLTLHILDTFFVVAYPGLYDHTLSMYGGRISGLPESWGINGYYWPMRWVFRLAELGLIASVVFHAINGLRIIAFDWLPGTSRHQRGLFWGVVAVFLVIMIPVAVVVFLPLMEVPERERAAAVAVPAAGG